MYILRKKCFIYFSSLEKSGRMWREAYEELMSASNTTKSED